jgi:hypothetical protein
MKAARLVAATGALTRPSKNRTSPLHPLWRELHTRTRRQVWKLKPNEPNLVKIEARTLGPTGTALLSPTCTDPRSAPQTSALTSFTPRFLEACESTVAARVAGVERRTLHPSPGRARRRASRARVPRATCSRAARQMCARCASASRTPASAAAQSTLTAP